jgi:hypothetical protein
MLNKPLVCGQFFQNVTIMVENIQIHMSWQVFFFNLKIGTNVKIKYEKGIFASFFREKDH